jgi:hypothetical protein
MLNFLFSYFLIVYTYFSFLPIVVLCQPQAEEGHAFKGIPKGMNLVVVEGGPYGIKKFVNLMQKR